MRAQPELSSAVHTMQSLPSSHNGDNCLTCLIKLDADQVPAAHPLDVELQRLLLDHSDWQPEELAADWLPHQLCDACHQQLINCAQFQRQTRACRLQLLTMMGPEDEPAIFEIVYDQEAIEEEEQQQQQQQLNKLTQPAPPPDPIDEPVKNDEDHPPEQLEQPEHLEQLEQLPDCTIRRRCRGVKNSFKCGQCGHSFAHTHTLAAHVRKVHEGHKRPFQCDRCDKTYSFMGGLYTHIREIHEPKERSYRCDHPGCERVYISSIAMQKHKRLKHCPPATPARKYVCEECGATFNQTANLKYHRRTKHPTADEAAANALNSEQHFCDKCQKHFHSRYTLKYHTMQQHGNEPTAGTATTTAASDVATMHECQVCGRRLAKRFMLVQHMLMHSAEKLPCEHCGRPFARKFELEAHIRAVHLKLKPFACKYCAESFASRKTLRHHEYIHTGEKPYVCDVCGQAFRQQTCLKNHGRVHDKHK